MTGPATIRMTHPIRICYDRSCHNMLCHVLSQYAMTGLVSICYYRFCHDMSRQALSQNVLTRSASGHFYLFFYFAFEKTILHKTIKTKSNFLLHKWSLNTFARQASFPSLPLNHYKIRENCGVVNTLLFWWGGGVVCHFFYLDLYFSLLLFSLSK